MFGCWARRAAGPKTWHFCSFPPGTPATARPNVPEWGVNRDRPRPQSKTLFTKRIYITQNLALVFQNLPAPSSCGQRSLPSLDTWVPEGVETEARGGEFWKVLRDEGPGILTQNLLAVSPSKVSHSSEFWLRGEVATDLEFDLRCQRMVRGGYRYYPFRCSFEVQYYLYMNSHHCSSGSIISSRCRSSTFDTDNENSGKPQVCPMR